MDDIQELIEQCREKQHQLWEERNGHAAELRRLEKLDYIDENQTVAWNRREKDRLIRSERAKIGAVNAKYKKVFGLVEDAIKEEIREYDIPESVVDMIYDRAYESDHSEGYYAVFQNAVSIAEFVERIIEAVT